VKYSQNKNYNEIECEVTFAKALANLKSLTSLNIDNNKIEDSLAFAEVLAHTSIECTNPELNNLLLYKKAEHANIKSKVETVVESFIPSYGLVDIITSYFDNMMDMKQSVEPIAMIDLE